MTPSEERQLEAEADAYQMEADARRERDLNMAALQSEIIVLRERLRKKDSALYAWQRAYRYEHSVRTRLERSIEFHKLATPMSGPMLSDLEAACQLAQSHLDTASQLEPLA